MTAVPFVYRRSDGSVIDPSAGLAALIRERLGLGPDWGVSIMQMSCGCTDPGCGEVETRTMITAPGRRPLRLRIPRPLRSVTAEDIRAVHSTGRVSPAALADMP